MIIRKVRIDNRRKLIEVDTRKGTFALPFTRLELIPTRENPVTDIYVDKELGKQGVTYVLQSGDEATLHLDAFLDYNHEPDFMRNLALVDLTIQCLEIVKKSRLSKRQIAGKLKTSAAQLEELLDTTNYNKTIDQMVKLVAGLNHWVDFHIIPCDRKKSAA